MKLKKENILPSIVLGSICLVVALLLSLVNMVTAPIIADRTNQEANKALLEVLPDGKDFEEITIDEKYPSAITKGYSADGGFVFQATVTGKSSGLVIMCGIGADGKVVGTKVIAEQETDSYDANVFPLVEGLNGKYKDMTLDGFEAYLVSGATLTSKAYGEAIKASLQAFVIANGGNVDTRTPEQILQDNCNAALGVSGVTFTKWFATEALDGIDAVYESASGRVFVIGEEFIGVDADGNAVGTSANASVAAAANATISAITLTSIKDSLDAIKAELETEKNAKIVEVYEASNGTLVFELEANGHSMKGKYGTKEVIKIKLSISADGKIIDVVTVSHDETKGYGDACANEDYYEQYKGKADGDIKVSSNSYAGYTDDLIAPDCTDIGVIAGATNTTIGYQKAVKLAFKAFELLKGGNN
jgi:electron transport complex protein RnfG